jgi:hypothetical protein
VRFLRFLRRVAVAAMLGGGAVLLYLTAVWYQYYDMLPRSPQPGVGRVWSVNMHGVIGYATRKEKSRLDDSFYLAAFLMNFGIVGCALTDSSFRKKMGWRPIEAPPGLLDGITKEAGGHT